MTTENNKPRSLHDLYNLGTYQEMTDEEIEMIIEDKIYYAIQNHETSEMVKARIAAMEQMVKDNKAALDESREMRKKRFERKNK